MSDEPMGDLPIPTAFEREDTGRWLQDADPPADRMDLLVGPQDKKWKLRHKYFTHLLETDIPIKDIIRESFTHHQYRLLAPAERPDVREIQDDNTKRYEALLARRFKGVEDSLATKLTMMWFGLPAAPMYDPLEVLAWMVGHGEEEVPRYNVKPPLHFLTAHDHRNWGKDSLKGKLVRAFTCT